MWGINIRNKFEYTHTYTHYLRWTLFHFLCMCKRTYDTMLCATLLLAINYCHFLLRMASDIVIRLPGFRLVFLIWNECAKSLQDSKFHTKDKSIMNIILYEICISHCLYIILTNWITFTLWLSEYWSTFCCLGSKVRMTRFK